MKLIIATNEGEIVGEIQDIEIYKATMNNTTNPLVLKIKEIIIRKRETVSLMPKVTINE